MMAGRISSSVNSFPIEKVEVAAYTIPTDYPESDGTIEWDRTTIVIVEVRAGEERGLGYTYADVSTAELIDSLLCETILGQDAMDIPGTWLSMIRRVRNLGRSGIASMAISAVDIALWDVKAHILHLPLFKLLGAVREGIPIYGSGGFTSYSIKQLQSQLDGWVRSGISAVKMKIGRNPENDIDRVRAAREVIGPYANLFVDANGAYSRKQALSFAERFKEFGVSWFEEPVSSDDLGGLRLVRDRAPAGMDIAAGEYGYNEVYFYTLIEAGAVDVLQADATRCGGVTGFLNVGALCFAQNLPLSAHTAPTVHGHLCCALPAARHVEYFHDHTRIERMCFESTTTQIRGELRPDRNTTGFGIQLRRSDIEKYRVS
jgi:L-alanine-DL-glutamate epimerase-like enolase superfamily enzyme